MTTPQQLLGIELPIVQAPMAGVQGSALVIAVCSAGGLGSLPCAMLDTAAIRAEVAAIRAATNRPFNLNFFCHVPPEIEPERERKWRAALAPYYTELGIEPSEGAGAQRRPFDAEMAALVEELRPPVVSFHFGLPDRALTERVRAAGAKILASATTVSEAEALAAHGVDAIIAQGIEAGGHRGTFLADAAADQIGTLALVPQIVRATGLPVIAAGGIADAAGVRAVLALGAVAAQVGTSYLLCPEATTSKAHRAALQSDRARSTVVTNLFTGRRARGIVNRLIEDLGAISALAPAFPLAAAALAPLRKQAESQGSGAFSPMWAGQNATGCKPVPAAQLTRELAGVA